MGKNQCNHGGLAPAQRGQIIQRVLADGWSPARAAQEFAVTERQVARWVAAYRRRGMASLRWTASEPNFATRWLSRLMAMLVRHRTKLRARGEPAPCVELRRTHLGRRQRS